MPQHLPVPIPDLQLYPSATFTRFPEYQRPRCTDLIVCLVLVAVVQETVPLWQSRNDMCDAIQKRKRDRSLRLLWREEVRDVISQCFKQSEEAAADAVEAVIGGGSVAIGKGFLQSGFVAAEDGDGG